MDYEKKYNEALNDMRAIYPNLKGDAKLAVEHAFPELRESEGEKVRQLIYSSIKNDMPIASPKNKELALSWLEKQKEPDKCPEYCVRSHCMGCSIYEKQKEQIPYIDFVIKPHKGDDNNPYDMQVSEAQEYAIKRGFGIPFNDGEVYVDERHMTQTIGNILRWADDHPKEQKPAWSEEDKRKLNRIYEILGYAADDKAFLKSKRIIGDKEAIELQDFLKSLRPQPKQEWSEEDEIGFADAIRYIQDYGETSSDKYTQLRTKEIVAWLKSLRPQWRPSEEQMGAFSWMLENARGNIDFDPLKDLYEQLKRMIQI